MHNDPRYLRSDVIIEPLVDRFYAWLHTVAPVPAAINLAHLQLPMLESYLKSPGLHVRAAHDPSMRGGYFVGIDEARADEVHDLLMTIKRDRELMFRVAAAVTETAETLLQTATGFDLTPLYAKLPPELSGLVELVYDTSNQASIRFIEPLVYRSNVYIEQRQSVQLSLDNGAERPFIFSTPRLPSPGTIDLPVPFRHPGLEELATARIRASTPSRLREMFDLDQDGAAQLDRLLADEPDLSSDRNVSAGGRIRYLGHACLVMQSAQTTIVTDPFISTHTAAGDRFTLRDLPDHIDLVLISHGHHDHIVLETLLQLRGRVGAVVVPRSSKGNLCDPSPGLFLSQLSFPVVEVDDFDEIEFDDGKVIATPFLGEHGDLDIRAKTTYAVHLAGRTIFVGADSSGIDPVVYRSIRQHVGDVDMAFLSMECVGAPLTWLYGPLLTRPVTNEMSGSRKLVGSNAAQAAAIMSELRTKEAYVYAMGEESWLQHVSASSYTENSYQFKQIDEFMTWCAARGIRSDHLYGRHEWRW